MVNTHLKEPLRSTSMHFCDLAQEVVDTLPRNPERTVALRKLLEAKDCAVRAVLPPGLEDEEPERAPLLAGESISAAAGRPPAQPGS